MRGRTYTEVLPVRLTQSDLDLLSSQAQTEGTTMAALLRRMIRETLPGDRKTDGKAPGRKRDEEEEAGDDG